MALENIPIPLYVSSGRGEEHKLIVNEFAGRIQLTVEKNDAEEITVECCFDDLQRAWDAVKNF